MDLRIHFARPCCIGSSTEEPTKRYRKERNGEKESDPIEMKSDFRSYVGFVQAPLTRYKCSFLGKSTLHFDFPPFCV